MAIDKLTKELCVGCAACEGVCPLECIVMQVDEDGFRYPHVDHDRCVECGRCDNVCPALSPREEQWTERAYAAINQDRQTREVSTSGGVFTALAESILDRGGVIYGAIYDEAWRVVHHRVDQRDDLALIRGSKYSQSDMSGVVSWVLQDLRAGRWVLFSGTQCQVDGVRRAAGKSLCDKLLLVDMICHGVPSPMIFEHYLNEIRKGGKIDYFAFRSKREGSWKESNTRYVVDGVEHIEAERTSHYLYAFLKDLILRPSCYHCPSKGGRSGSDLTIADFWGLGRVMPEIDDNRGCSLVLVGSERGEVILSSISERVTLYEVDPKEALVKNPSYGRSVVEPVERRRALFDMIHRGKTLLVAVESDRKSQMTMKQLCRHYIRNILNLLQ